MRAFAVRLTPGTDLRAELKRLAEGEGLRAGCILSAVGSLKQARLRMPGVAGEPETFRSWDQPMEIVSLGGTLSEGGMHVHISLSGPDGVCVGGHLVAGCIVHTTAEVVIGELEDVEFRREPDAETGYLELAVKRREP